MATTIRLTRMGRKKRPFYRMVVLDSRKRRDGAYLANLGYYNPFCEPAEVELHSDDIINWLDKGATMSETARSLLRQEGVLYRWSLLKADLGEEEITAQMTEWRQASDDRRAKMQEATAAKKAAKVQALADKVKAEEEAKAEAEAKVKAEEAAKAKAEADEKAAEEAAAAAEAAEAAAAAAAEEAPEVEEAPEAVEAAEATEAPAEKSAEGTDEAAAVEETKKESDGEGES